MSINDAYWWEEGSPSENVFANDGSMWCAAMFTCTFAQLNKSALRLIKSKCVRKKGKRGWVFVKGALQLVE